MSDRYSESDRMSEMVRSMTIRSMDKVKMIDHPEHGTNHEVLEQRIYEDGSKSLNSCIKKGRKIFYVIVVVYLDHYGRLCNCHDKPEQKRKLYREFATLSAARTRYNNADPFDIRLQQQEYVRHTLD
jgi:hypothetical protein